MKKITDELLKDYKFHLICEEKSILTQKKYIADVTAFITWLGECEITKEKVLDYKSNLMERLLPSSVNSHISSLNNFFEFCGWTHFKVKTIKIQKRIFLNTDTELKKDEYQRLLSVAEKRGNRRLLMIMQTICATGIRVSELKFITVESLRSEQALINCKGKMRVVMLPRKLCKMLYKYIKKEKIRTGSIFCTRSGLPLDRSNIWAEMKKLCDEAEVDKKKVFPHNLRHLFARTYYTIQHDIVRLADILGHSSINTTRIYTMESGDIHRRQIQHLGLLKC